MCPVLPLRRDREVGDMSTRVLLCGVGGQGTILAAHILADVAMACGMDVKVSEIHGMAQRGGSVTTVVTFGADVLSMVCGTGEADVLVSFDKLEALRNIEEMKAAGMLIVNDEVIKPISVLTGRGHLPRDTDEVLGKFGALMVPAEATAKDAGNTKTQNIVMLGALSFVLEFPEDAWEKAIRESVPPKTVEVNLAAFKLGRAFAKEHA